MLGVTRHLKTLPFPLLLKLVATKDELWLTNPADPEYGRELPDDVILRILLLDWLVAPGRLRELCAVEVVRQFRTTILRACTHDHGATVTICDNRYVTSPTVLFIYDTQTHEHLKELPHAAVEFATIDLCELLRQYHQRTSHVDSSTGPSSPDTDEKAPESVPMA